MGRCSQVNIFFRKHLIIFYSFQYGITINGTVVKFCKLISYILVFIHINAVILFLVPAMMDFPGHYEPDDPGFNVFGPSWPFLRNLQHEEPFIQYRYFFDNFLKIISNFQLVLFQGCVEHDGHWIRS